MCYLNNFYFIFFIKFSNVSTVFKFNFKIKCALGLFIFISLYDLLKFIS